MDNIKYSDHTDDNLIILEDSMHTLNYAVYQCDKKHDAICVCHTEDPIIL